MSSKEGKRAYLLREQNGLCPYCGELLVFVKKENRTPEDWKLKPTFDHIIPKIKRGAQGVENLMLVHSDCNLFKGNRTPEELMKFFKHMEVAFKNKPGKALTTTPV